MKLGTRARVFVASVQRGRRKIYKGSRKVRSGNLGKKINRSILKDGGQIKCEKVTKRGPVEG